jgi:hypothetical protein
LPPESDPAFFLLFLLRRGRGVAHHWPKDYVKDEAEEARALANALAETAEAGAAKKIAEEADHRAALQAVAAFQEREDSREQRLAAAARALLPSY